MKIINMWTKEQIIRYNEKRFQKEIDRRRRKRHIRRMHGKTEGSIVSSSIKETFRDNDVVVKFPSVIDLYDERNCSKILDFFNKNFNEYEKYTDGVIFKFPHTHLISLSGGILLRCLYDYLRSKNIKINISSVNDDKTRQILSHIGVFKERIVITHQDIYRWKIQDFDKSQIKRKRQLQGKMLSTIIKDTTDWPEQSSQHKRLYEIIPEALYNCIDHAYKNDDKFQKFYLFSGMVNNNYVFCVLDRGMGFKKTYEKRKTALPLFDPEIENDGDYIKYSIEQSISSLSRQGRGNGLSTLKENITGLHGNIFIHSYKGKVSISATENELKSENRFPLVGSLLQFSVPMPSEKRILIDKNS